MNKNIDIEYIQNNVKATLAIESLAPSTYGENTTNEFLTGKITSLEVVERIKSYHLEKYLCQIKNKEYLLHRKIQIFNIYMYCATSTLDIERSKTHYERAFNVLSDIMSLKSEISFYKGGKVQ